MVLPITQNATHHANGPAAEAVAPGWPYRNAEPQPVSTPAADGRHTSPAPAARSASRPDDTTWTCSAAAVAAEQIHLRLNKFVLLQGQRPLPNESPVPQRAVAIRTQPFQHITEQCVQQRRQRRRRHRLQRYHRRRRYRRRRQRQHRSHRL